MPNHVHRKGKGKLGENATKWNLNPRLHSLLTYPPKNSPLDIFGKQNIATNEPDNSQELTLGVSKNTTKTYMIKR
jgi:hypothetical protein